MLSRRLMVGLGVLALLAGVMLAFLWFRQSSTPVTAIATVEPPVSILVAAHPIPAGTLLRLEDMVWSDVPAAAADGGDIVRGGASETDFVGAAARRSFAERDPLSASMLVKPGSREFLVAALRPGYRAVSIAVDPVQSTSGLVAPGDRVDVILTQFFSAEGADAGRKSVGETVLSDLRVIAIDQTLTVAIEPATKPPASTELKMPKTVTLEVTERQAAMLLVAEQLGKVALALRGPQAVDALPGASPKQPPIWASDVSQALANAPAPSAGKTQATIEVIHGGKTERRCATNAGLVTCP